MRVVSLFIIFIVLCGCASRKSSDQSEKLVSMQIIDRNGFTETISNKDRLSDYRTVDFEKPQPYQKVLRVFGRNAQGQASSKITSYHDNSHLWQYLEVTDGRAHGLYQEWFANGRIHIEAHLIEGVADLHDLAQTTWVFEGLCKAWNEQGDLAAEFYYEKGLLQNEAKYFYPSGKLQRIIPYHQGEVHGIVQTFDEEGNLLENTPFSNGDREGSAIAYWSPGRLLSEETYEQGRLINAAYYDPQGTRVAEVKNGFGKQAQFEEEILHSLIEYSKGIPEGEVQLFFPSGALKCTYIVKEGKKNGEEWEYYPQETLTPKLCVHWNEDQIQGQVKTWYPNGQIESQREFNGNKKQGTAFAWYKNGDLMLVEEYENDLLIKGSYYKKGDKKIVSRIDSGKGTASLYSSDGFFLKKVPYEKGKPQLDKDPA
jgi:antitoxin component YwqK of YwqJK toxin-antitoxin module